MASLRHSYVFELDCDPPVRLWTGFGDLVVDGIHYLGADGLISTPDVRQLINGVSERIEFNISGVSNEANRVLQEDKASVYLAAARFGRVIFDENWQTTNSIAWEWEGQCDLLNTNSAQNEGQRTRTVSVGMGSADTRRSNPQIAFFTDADQRRRSPTDAFFSHVSRITQGSTRRFGPR